MKFELSVRMPGEVTLTDANNLIQNEFKKDVTISPSSINYDYVDYMNQEQGSIMCTEFVLYIYVPE